MKIKNTKALAVTFFLMGLALILGLTGCPTTGTSTVTGTITLFEAAGAADTWAVLVDDDQDGGNGSVGSDGGTFVGGELTVDYSISDIPDETYYIMGLVDRDGSQSPNVGDDFGFYGGGGGSPTAVPGEASYDFTLSRL